MNPLLYLLYELDADDDNTIVNTEAHVQLLADLNEQDKDSQTVQVGQRY